MKRMIKKIVLLLSLLTSTPMAIASGTLIYCSEGSPAGFDPAQYLTGTDFDASAETVFNRLVQFKRGSTDIEPGLAKSWTVSKDGLIYTFALQDNVQFHTTPYFKPTRAFNADDVLFTFERMLNKNHPFNKAYSAQFPYFEGMGMTTNIVKIEKLNDLSVRFTLKAVDAAFVYDMAMSFASIQSSEYANQLLKSGKASQLNTQPIGTGPFIFERYQKDAQIRYLGNTKYWKPGEVKIDHLIFAITPDAEIRYQKLKTNECQVSVYPRPADVAAMRADPNIIMLTQPGFNLGYLAYNVTHKPLEQLKVRQALDMSINKKAILLAVYQGSGQLAENVLPPTQWSYNKSIKDAPFNIAAAKKLLAEAGYPKGFDLTLWAMPVQRPYNPNAMLMAQMIQSDWGKLGVHAKIVTYEWGEYVKRATNGEHDTILIGWNGDNGDPDNWLGTLFSCDAVSGGNNYSRWCYKPFEALIQHAKRSTDKAVRTKDYMEAQVIVKQQVPVTPIANSTVNQPVRKEVSHFKVSPFGLNSFYGVSVKQ